MSKKKKSIQVKLIANPGAGKAGESAKNLKLVIGYLEKLGFKVNYKLCKTSDYGVPSNRQRLIIVLPSVTAGRLQLNKDLCPTI